VALYRAETDDGWVYDRTRDEQEEIVGLTPHLPQHRDVLDRLHADVVSLMHVAA
jgi:hypothetical protein